MEVRIRWVNSLGLKLEEPRPREGQELVQNQEQGRTKLWPGIRLLQATSHLGHRARDAQAASLIPCRLPLGEPFPQA